MNSSKKINVNFSSLVGLKAELLRKQTEVNEVKFKTTNDSIPKSHNNKLNNKKRTKNIRDKNAQSNKNEQNYEEIEDVSALKKSRLMLEAKTRLYEKMRRNKNQDDKFLVDFTNKSDSESEIQHKSDSEDEIYCESDYDDTASNPEDEWIEYEDCFGRTRRCLRKDLPHMQKKDDLIKKQISKTEETVELDTAQRNAAAHEKEPEIEIMRKKWEKQTEKLAEKVDIHYEDVLFDEARAHGVGYYAFSQDEDLRIKQQENLLKLRKETEKKQEEMKELKELRSKMEANRLKAARIRKRIRAGLPAEPTEEELKEEEVKNPIPEELPVISEDKQLCVAENNVLETKTPKDEIVNSSVETEKKVKEFEKLLEKRVWREMSQEEWVEKRREDRINEFKPVYDNFIKGDVLEVKSMTNTKDGNSDVISSIPYSPFNSTKNTDHQNVMDSIPPVKDQDNCDIIGPLPPHLHPNYQNAINQPTTVINEDIISAGLKYLREEFENNKS